MHYFAYSQKAFVYKYIVMFSDIDQFKHMTFANYLKLMFLATDALFVACCNDDFLSKNRLRLQSSKMQFKRQTVSGDHILIKVNSSHNEERNFSLLFTFVIEATGELVSLGKQVYQLESLVSSHQDGDAIRLDAQKKFFDILEPISVDEEHLLYKY